MKLPAILVADLHLTANPDDEYRWGLFPWLCNELDLERAETLVILGDLTDAKDYHPAQLVNRVVKAIDSLRAHVPRIVILRGNHDFLKDGHVFFEFLSALPGVEVITQPTEDAEQSKLTMFLPYTKTPATDWKGWDFSHYDYLFLHQTIKGARASNGQQMDGEDLPPLNATKVFSGDIHVPQRCGAVEYVGSPYHVHFGDAFKPRCVALDRAGAQFDLVFPSIKRLTLDVRGVRELRVISLGRADQVKIRVHLSEAEKHEWRSIRDEAVTIVETAGANLKSIELVVEKTRERVRVGQPAAKTIDPARILYDFVDADDLGGELLDAGLECLED